MRKHTFGFVLLVCSPVLLAQPQSDQRLPPLPGSPPKLGQTPPPDPVTLQRLTKPPVPQFKFQFDDKAPVKNFIPQAKRNPTKFRFIDDLSQAPELSLHSHVKHDAKPSEALKKLAERTAKVRHVNKNDHDAFIKGLIEHRKDLTGLPFLMGEKCRQTKLKRQRFATSVGAIHALRGQQVTISISQMRQAQQMLAKAFWDSFAKNSQAIAQHSTPALEREFSSIDVDALMQILAPESDAMLIGFVRYLSKVPSEKSTVTLAKLAIFSEGKSVRDAAIEALQLRREKHYTVILEQGLCYPYPAVAERACEAITQLQRKDLISTLVTALQSSDPRLPRATKTKDGTKIVVRELVRINHHRNCLMCHAPGMMKNDGTVLQVQIPLPTQELPSPSQSGGYGSSTIPDIVVRTDVTYLRQDFSRMLPVRDADLWPKMQRFDFLVRERALTQEEVRAFEASRKGSKSITPYQSAIQKALEKLTGKKAKPDAKAWRKALSQRDGT